MTDSLNCKCGHRQADHALGLFKCEIKDCKCILFRREGTNE